MINISTEGKDNSKYVNFINECVVALFPEDADYDIFFEFKKFVDDDGTHAGFCLGDDEEAVISIASHWIYEGEEVILHTNWFMPNSFIKVRSICKITYGSVVK